MCALLQLSYRANAMSRFDSVQAPLAPEKIKRKSIDFYRGSPPTPDYWCLPLPRHEHREFMNGFWLNNDLILPLDGVFMKKTRHGVLTAASCNLYVSIAPSWLWLRSIRAQQCSIRVPQCNMHAPTCSIHVSLCSMDAPTCSIYVSLCSIRIPQLLYLAPWIFSLDDDLAWPWPWPYLL